MVAVGVVIGGVLVYRTKRESHEALFPNKPVESPGPVNVDEMFAVEEDDPLLEIAQVQNARFLAQVAAAKDEVAAAKDEVAAAKDEVAAAKDEVAS